MNEETTQITPLVQTALLFAARYAHHRQTGGAYSVCRALDEVWGHLSERIKEQIISESHEATFNLTDWRSFRDSHTALRSEDNETVNQPNQ
jgi:hypothetical protein